MDLMSHTQHMDTGNRTDFSMIYLVRILQRVKKFHCKVNNVDTYCVSLPMLSINILSLICYTVNVSLQFLLVRQIPSFSK